MRNLGNHCRRRWAGGLCLAHGLRDAGVNVRLFERDRGPTDRMQGYRLTINAGGARALRSCPPTANFERSPRQPRSAPPSRSTISFAVCSPSGFRRTINRRPRPLGRSAASALRQILLEGLEDVVSFGKTFAPDGRVVAHFDDGSIAEGDVLVGADGAGSHVRRQLLPQAERIDTGIVRSPASSRSTRPSAVRRPRRSGKARPLRRTYFFLWSEP
jgi:2-polyprenyl-6-methoxyphenol hydroxylase-like FAD-dependent oxidoreductase